MDQENMDIFDKLEEENKELKTVLRKLSHEMGNALTLLGASIFYLESDIANDDEKCDITDLKNDYTYICNLFKELREYNHTEAIKKTEIKIEDIVNDIVKSFSHMVGSENILLYIHKQEKIDEKTVHGDMTKLRQAFLNILKNCIDAISENDENKGKIIVVNVKIMQSAYDKVINSKNGDVGEMVHIEIRDNGIGICEENINKIFKPMFTYGKKDGTGLGLSIVKKIIEDHEGKIEAVSVLGTGTAIHIYLPILN